MILKIDTTDSSKVVVEITDHKLNKIDQLIETKKFGSETLLPLILKIFNKNKISFEDLTEVKVNIGPGSFTGTRVGVAVANALSFALGIPVNGKRGKIVLPKYSKSKFDF